MHLEMGSAQVYVTEGVLIVGKVTPHDSIVDPATLQATLQMVTDGADALLVPGLTEMETLSSSLEVPVSASLEPQPGIVDISACDNASDAVGQASVAITQGAKVVITKHVAQVRRVRDMLAHVMEPNP